LPRLVNILICGLMFALLFQLPAHPTNAQASTDTFAIGWDSSPIDQINPMLTTLYDGGAWVISHIIYDKLVQTDSYGNIIPDLADSWTYTDPQTITFDLAHNATWHDGVPFTANDVVFTINHVTANQAIYPHIGLYVQNIASAQAVDNYTVQIKLKATDATFFSASLLQLVIVPQHIWAKFTGNFSTFTDLPPVGTGPFKFVSWEPNSYVQLDANPNYFRGAPHIKHLIIRYYNSVNAMVLALQSGEIDLTSPLLPPTVVSSLTSNPDIQVFTRPDLRYFYLTFNQFPGGTGNPTLRDERVRQALEHAVDKNELAQRVWLGFADVLNTVVPTSLGDWHNPNTPDYAFDLNMSRKILDSAGYKLGPDGVRVSPAGVKMVYHIDVPSDYSEEYRAAQLIAGWWAQIGVKATPRLMDSGSLGSEEASWQHDVVLWTWSADFLDPAYFLSMFTTSQDTCNPGCLGDAGWSNSTYDKLFVQQSQETDPAVRKQIIWELQDILTAHAVYDPLYDNDAINGFRSDLFTGIPPGVIPPFFYFGENSLLLNVRPIGMATETASMSTERTTTGGAGMSTGTTVGIVVVLIVLIAAGVFYTRRKKTSKS
jgi:peptide/nickel transport system substrate-binding protein